MKKLCLVLKMSDYACYKLERGSSAWTPVVSGVRFFEAAMVIYDGGSKILAIGGRYRNLLLFLKMKL